MIAGREKERYDRCVCVRGEGGRRGGREEGRRSSRVEGGMREEATGPLEL